MNRVTRSSIDCRTHAVLRLQRGRVASHCGVEANGNGVLHDAVEAVQLRTRIVPKIRQDTRRQRRLLFVICFIAALRSLFLCRR